MEIIRWILKNELFPMENSPFPPAQLP